MLLFLSLATATAARPVPTPAQLAWQADEIGVIIHFNMATMMGSQGINKGIPPPPSKWTPARLDTDQWVEAMDNLGAKYAVYVAKHCSGFATWPSNITLPFLPGPGGSYGYSVKDAPVKTDVAGSFAASCRKKGIKPGFYYSLGANSYTKNQLKLTQDQFDQVVLAQTRELWSNYGTLGEIWFDGGYSQAIKQNLTDSINSLQPDAIVFQGAGVANSPVRWIGTEAGRAPYPNWSPNDGNAAGAGAPDGADWVPGEVDTTLQENDQWFYNKGHAIRSLKELQDVYHGSVGRNGNLLLDMAPTPDGVIDDAAFARYKEFGDWIRGCYGAGQEVGEAGPGVQTTFELALVNGTHPSAPVGVDRVVIQEDQTKGEVIRTYAVAALTASGWVNVTSGQSVGNKRIDIFAGGAVWAQKLRLTLGAAAGDTPALKRFAAYAPARCGGAAPPAPHSCATAAAGQRGGFYPCTYGAHQKWELVDAGAGKKTVHLSGLSDGVDLCLSVAPLPRAAAAARARGGGAYTNATALRECDGGADQLWAYSAARQLTHEQGGQVGCLDCAHCQDSASDAWLYTPCFNGDKGSPNEEFAYDENIATLVDLGFGKCLGTCA